jgi:hypothetical protein
MQRELDGTRAQVCIDRRIMHIRPYTHSYMRTRAARRHRRRRRAQQPRMRRRPTERSPPRCACGPEAAHTEDNVVTEAVFHAPMFALKADAERNACEPINATLGGGVKCSHTSARMQSRQRTSTSACTHARLVAYMAHIRLGGTRVRRSAYTAGLCI